MQIVIDTSAVMAVILNEDSKPAIVEATIDTTLSAPGSLHWEVGNALSSLLKQRRITLEQALTAERQLEPNVKSCCSIKPIRSPRIAASRAVPDPTIPPPITKTSRGLPEGVTNEFSRQPKSGLILWLFEFWIST